MTVYLGYRVAIGALMTANFLGFWAVPIALMGQIWKLALQFPLRPLFNALDDSKLLRWVGETYVYAKPKYADFFAISVLVTISMVGSLLWVFHRQLTYGKLDWWVLFVYYCSWVGLGGRTMGGAYTLAHKEGHNAMLYKKWWRNSIGNFFEDVIGVFYGSVPTNFTTSHVHIHHKLNAGRGDTFYQWDLDRTSGRDFMIFQHRILMHMSGISSLRFFRHTGRDKIADKLKRGMMTYWVLVPSLVFLVTRSFSFLFWVYLEPLLCMTYFLALINFAFHGFIDFDEEGKHIACVNSLCIIEGDDDYFGEDDHMAHHYATGVFHRDLPQHQKAQLREWQEHKASVFRKLSIVELAVFLILGLWDKLADHFVDFSDDKMPKEEVMAMLKRRAKLIECTPEEYIETLSEREANYRKDGPIKVVTSNTAARGLPRGEAKALPDN